MRGQTPGKRTPPCRPAAVPETPPLPLRTVQPLDDAGAPREETSLAPPLPPSPRHGRPDEALRALGLDDAVQTQLYDQARAALVAEGTSPWHLILPHIQCRMLALWEARTLPRGAALDPQPGEARAGGRHEGRAA